MLLRVYGRRVRIPENGKTQCLNPEDTQDAPKLKMQTSTEINKINTLDNNILKNHQYQQQK